MKKYTLYYYDAELNEHIKKFFRLKNAYQFLHEVYDDIENDWKEDFIHDFPYKKVKKHIKWYKKFTFIDDTIYYGKRKEEEV